MHRLAIAITVTIGLSGCTHRQQDFAFFATALALEVASAVSEPEPVVVVAAPNPDTYRGPTQADLERAYDTAMELTRIAATDARNDNCPAVLRTAKHVRVIDPHVFANVFVKDEPIKLCLRVSLETNP